VNLRRTRDLAVLLFVWPMSSGALAQGRPDLEGFWMTPLTSFDDPRWRIEDLVCARTGCSLAGFKYLQALLADPANRDRTVKELYYDMQAFDERHVAGMLTPLGLAKQAEYDPAHGAALDCKPDSDGLRHQIVAPLPVVIEQHDDRVVIRYEYWNAERIIWMDGRGHPPGARSTRLGHSIGRYEGDTLVVETSGITPNLIGLPTGGALVHSEDLRAIERYTRSADGQRLDLEWTFLDPVHFREPYQGQRSALYFPAGELDTFECEAITGEY
jgi:hypothetical protein